MDKEEAESLRTVLGSLSDMDWKKAGVAKKDQLFVEQFWEALDRHLGKWRSIDGAYKMRKTLALAGLAGFISAFMTDGGYRAPGTPHDAPPSPSQEKRWRAQRGYPQTGTGIRAGARLERQVARAMRHPFEASNRCIERIKARLAAWAALR
jgi:hypothetical protein